MIRLFQFLRILSEIQILTYYVNFNTQSIFTTNAKFWKINCCKRFVSRIQMQVLDLYLNFIFIEIELLI